MGDTLVRADSNSRDTTARSLAGLDWVNFFLADVASGLGPFLAVYLLAKRDWNAGSIGVVLTHRWHSRAGRADAGGCDHRRDPAQAGPG